MSRRTVTLIVGVLVLIALAVGGAQLPVQYAAEAPGPTFNTLGSANGQQVIAISGRTPDKTSGNLNMTTVSVYDHLDLLSALRGWFASDQSVVPREVLFPPNETSTQIQRQNTQEFTSSQDSAIAAALGKLGYPNKIVVVKLQKGSPAAGRLAPGDTIDAINGTSVANVANLTSTLKKFSPGTALTVTSTRNGHPRTVRIVSTKAPDRSGAALGVFVSYQRVAPFKVSIRLADVGGPSAGLMFTLGILDKVGKDDLTDGKFIAGTGTIDPNGKVGAIGGIPLKMIAARRAGASVFLVPAENCAEAAGHDPAGLRLIKVTSLDSALSALHTLHAGGSPPHC